MPGGVGVHLAPAAVARRRRAQVAAVRMALGTLAGLGLTVAFIRLIDVHSVLTRVQHLDVGLALLGGLVFLSAYVVRALRWRLFLTPNRVSVSRAVAIYQVAIFINWLLPVRGGELVKSLLLRRLDGIPVSRSLPTVTMDKAMDLLPAVALLAILPVTGLQLSHSLWALLLFVVSILGLGAVALALAASRRRFALSVLHRLTSNLSPALRQRVEPFLVRFVDTLLTLVRRPRLLLVAAGFTVVAVGLDALFCLLAFQAVGANVTFPIVLYGYTFYNLAYVLPTPPGQIGSNELIGLLVFSGLFHVSRSAVAAMFVFSHPWTALLMTCSGLLCLGGMGLTLRATLFLAREPAPAEGGVGVAGS